MAHRSSPSLPFVRARIVLANGDGPTPINSRSRPDDPSQGGAAATQDAALIVFRVGALAQAEIAIVSFFIAPDTTRRRIEQLYVRASVHGAGHVGVDHRRWRLLGNHRHQKIDDPTGVIDAFSKPCPQAPRTCRHGRFCREAMRLGALVTGVAQTNRGKGGVG
jgi:hypothetical protein